MYKLFSDLIGTIPTSLELIVPIGYCILMILLVLFLLRLGGIK